ncbi:unnamed protein product [Amaranthus hypochondriacus]
MGNCLKSQGKTVQVVKPDGKILEYKALIKVSEVLAEFKGYELSDELVVLQYLNPNEELVAGRLYYLIHVPTPSLKVRKKKVRFVEPEKEEAKKNEETSLTVKLVIKKQDLKEMLESGAVLLDELVSKQKLDGSSCGSETWMPSLNSIREVD